MVWPISNRAGYNTQMKPDCLSWCQTFFKKDVWLFFHEYIWRGNSLGNWRNNKECSGYANNTALPVFCSLASRPDLHIWLVQTNKKKSCETKTTLVTVALFTVLKSAQGSLSMLVWSLAQGGAGGALSSIPAIWCSRLTTKAHAPLKQSLRRAARLQMCCKAAPTRCELQQRFN